MNNGQNNITDTILIKYLLGEASEAEQLQVTEWIKENPGNEKQFNDLKFVWEQSRTIAASSTINIDASWEKFVSRTKNTVPFTSGKRYNWLKLAALVLLAVGGATLLFIARQQSASTAKVPVAAKTTPATIVPKKPSETIKDQSIANNSKKPAVPEVRQLTTVKKHIKTSSSTADNKAMALASHKQAKDESTKTKGIICNGTTCPIEICITQTIKCHGMPSVVSTCSTLEPDEAGKLHYRTHDKIGRHCTMSVDEITIKTISTGETIVLNANSKPATAQDFFNYIKKGGVIASAFQNDCSTDHDCGLKFNNNFGDLILQ